MSLRGTDQASGVSLSIHWESIPSHALMLANEQEAFQIAAKRSAIPTLVFRPHLRPRRHRRSPLPPPVFNSLGPRGGEHRRRIAGDGGGVESPLERFV